MMRGKPSEYNNKVMDAAEEFLGYGVAGVDLAGNEAAYPPQIYEGFLRGQKTHIFHLPYMPGNAAAQSILPMPLKPVPKESVTASP